MAVTLCKENADYFDVDQYDNPNNPEAYYRTLGPEVCLMIAAWPDLHVRLHSNWHPLCKICKWLRIFEPCF